MNILVDADACPVKEIILETAEKYNISVTMFMDTSHIMNNIVCEVVTVDKGHDSADFAIANRISKGDIAVTQDYGLACMLMARGAHVINQNGFLYTDENIDSLLMRRHVSGKLRRSGKKSGRMNHISARKREDDERFKSCLENLILKLLQ
ncbi:MAG: YaiI/YqxD family protein [Candidatus Metalachnospira sp.]|nr:YaiI/YqxD family protein [Candidatus Metalachnospira sp.]